MCSETFNTVLKVAGILLVIIGFFVSRIDFMLLGIFFVLLVLSNMLTCEAYELSNQIGNARDELKDKFSESKDG
jgi:hypothetical protein